MGYWIKGWVDGWKDGWVDLADRKKKAGCMSFFVIFLWYKLTIIIIMQKERKERKMDFTCSSASSCLFATMSTAMLKNLASLKMQKNTQVSSHHSQSFYSFQLAKYSVDYNALYLIFSTSVDLSLLPYLDLFTMYCRGKRFY